MKLLPTYSVYTVTQQLSDVAAKCTNLYPLSLYLNKLLKQMLH